MEYYHNLVTEKSWELLKRLQKNYKFILIGGWAVFLWTKSLKSKDIDIVVDFEELEKLRQNFDLTKNDRLQKYEIKKGEVDIDIYVHHYSNPGLPAEEIAEWQVEKEGFSVPRTEILLLLKQKAFEGRKGSPKGEKDKIDIFTLLALPEFDWDFYYSQAVANNRKEMIESLKNILTGTREVLELEMSEHKFSKFKKQILNKLEHLSQ